MVEAIRTGRKTQTRRPMKDQPTEMDPVYFKDFKKDFGARVCPYGIVGDRLVVREMHYQYGQWEWDMSKYGNHLTFKRLTDEIRYANDPPGLIRTRQLLMRPGWYKRPGLFMFRKDCRLVLEIEEIRAQQVQDITEEDTRAEGCIGAWGMGCEEVFRNLWDSINGKKYPWASNPFVWPITFKEVPNLTPYEQARIIDQTDEHQAEARAA